jgi:NAD-dependent deacetylase
MQDFSPLFALLEQSKKTVAFTGAGVSTLSGIPDFRGPKGVFAHRWQNWSVEELHDIEVFQAHPDAFYSYAKNSWYAFDTLPVNIVHQVLAELEQQGLLAAIYTQNIDMLHQKAGSRRVEELHGTMAGHHCLQCGRRFPYADIKALVLQDQVPRCPQCQGLIKPDVVFFGEGLDFGMLQRAQRDFTSADLTLVLGSSLTVEPAASLPRLTLHNHGRLVIVNGQPTSLDHRAELCYNDLESVFTALKTWLDKK